MAKDYDYQSSFNTGEISPLLFGNTAFDKRAAGLEECENFYTLKYGPLEKRPGTKYIADAKQASADTILVPFEFSNDTTYVLEFSNNAIRFFSAGSQVQSGTSPLEVVTTYTTAELRDLQFAQTLDTLYIAHKDHKLAQLVRNSHTSWTLSDVTYKFMPLLDLVDESGTGNTLSTSATSGSVTVTAAGGHTPFQSSDVGRFLRLTDSADCTGWEPPLQITAFSSSTSVTATVLNSQTLSATGAFVCWHFGAYSDTEGPAAISFHQQRLFLGGGVDTDKSDNQQRVYASKTGKFLDFEPNQRDTGEPVDDDGLSYKIASDKSNDIRWLKSGRDLFIGAVDSEFTLTATNRGPLTPSDAAATRVTQHGSKNIRPIYAGNNVLFVQASGRKIRQLGFNFSTDAYQGIDLNLLAEHITTGELTDMTFQNEPYSLLWSTRTDGQAPVATFDIDQNVTSFQRIIIGGTDAKIISIASVPSTSEDRDEVYAVVQRTINSATDQYVEIFDKEFSFQTTVEEAFFVDSGITQRTASNVTITVDAANNTTTGDTIRFNDTTSTSPLFTNIDLVEGTDWNTGASATLTAEDIRDAINNDATLSLYMSATAASGVVTVTDLTSTTRSKKWTCKDTVDANSQLTVGNTDANDFWLATTTVSGLDHLEGESVAVLTDGAPHPNKTVSSGSITLDYSAVIVHAGLPFTAKIKTLRPDSAVQFGSSKGARQRIHDVGIDVFEAATFKVGPDTSNLQSIEFRDTNDPMDEPVPLFTGIVDSTIKNRWGRSNQVVIQSDSPVPLTIRGIVKRLNANEP